MRGSRILTAAWACLVMAGIAGAAEPYADVLGYEFGKDRKPLAAVEEAIRQAAVKDYPAIEARLLATLQDKKATFACKQWVCRRLREVGSEKCLPVLAGLLDDEKLAHFARLAMEGMESGKVDEILRDALKKTDGGLRIGIISSLGARADEKAAGQIAAFLDGKDADLVGAAIYALGRIATAEAATLLKEADVPEKLAARKKQARIDCGYAMAKAGDTAGAAKIATELFAAGNSPVVRTGALGLLFAVEPQKAVAAAMKLLKGDDARMAAAAGQLLSRAKGEGITGALVERLDGLDPAAQAVLISTLATRGDSAAAPAMVKIMKESSSDEVRLAAVKALGSLGGGDEAAALCGVLTDKKLGGPAATSLERMRGTGVGAAIGTIATGDGDEDLRARLVEILARRRDDNAKKIVMQAAGDSSEAVRRAAYKALGSLGTPDDLEKMVAMLTAEKSPTARGELARSLFIIADKLDGPARTAAVIAGLEKAPDAAVPALLDVLGRLGGDAALAVVKKRAAADDADIAKAAIKAMVGWPDTSPMDALLKIAETEKDAVRKILALRGFITMAGRPSSRPLEQTVALLEKAMTLAERADEKRAILSRLPDFATEKSLAIAEKFTGDPALKKEASRAVAEIKKVLSRPAATASRNQNKAARALDGNAKSRWDTGGGMQPGDWFKVEFRTEPRKLKGFTMTLNRSGNDYPRAYAVFILPPGGEKWTGPVAKGKGRRKKSTVVKFKKPLDVQAIKIVQKGTAGNHWSIHEFTFDVVK